MRIFDHPNKTSGFKCPICGKDDDKKIVLIGIEGTQEGHNMQARQVHLDCLDLTLREGLNNLSIIYQSFNRITENEGQK